MSLKLENNVIDLCSSPEDSKPLTQAMIHEFFPTQHQSHFRIPSPSMDLSCSELKPLHLVEPAPGIVHKGSIFTSWEDAHEAIYAHEACLGHRWRIAQGRIDKHGNRKKVTFQCNHYYHTAPIHLIAIDPADHRCGKTIKTGCSAHVNINLIASSSLYHVTLTHWDHNHP